MTVSASRSSKARSTLPIGARSPCSQRRRPKSEAAAPDAKPAAGVQTVYVDKASGLPVRNIVTKADAADKRLFDGTFSVPSDLDIKPPADVK